MASLLHISRSATRRFGVAIGAMLVVVLLCDRARPDVGLAYGVDDYVQYPQAADLWKDYRDPGVVFWTQPPGPQCWTIDYRIQQMFGSRTSYQFGTAPQSGGPQYAPLSKLDWSLDSTWTGLRVGVQKPNWDVHFEWLTAMVQDINGSMEDFDWSGLNTAPASLSSSPERWNDGQKIELEADYKWSECFLGLPIELWPLAGFRFQRFDMTAHDGDQLINDGTLGPDLPPVGYHWTEDTITFNQQYYIGYIGGQLRAAIERACRPPVVVTFQFDYGLTSGYNVDHHISGYEAAGIHRYTMESTTGGALHFALTAEAPLTERLSLGLQADHTEISTTGSHRWVMSGNTTPVDETWDNGVSVSSRQTAITAFLRLRI